MWELGGVNNPSGYPIASGAPHPFQCAGVWGCGGSEGLGAMSPPNHNEPGRLGSAKVVAGLILMGKDIAVGVCSFGGHLAADNSGR